jgi:hypothetical protein
MFPPIGVEITMPQVEAARNGLSRSRDLPTLQVIRRENAALRRDRAREAGLGGGRKTRQLRTRHRMSTSAVAGDCFDEARETRRRPTAYTGHQFWLRIASNAILAA